LKAEKNQNKSSGLYQYFSRKEKNVQKQILNVIKFMFDELNGMKIDHSRNVGITNSMKSYTTFSNEIIYSLHNAGFIDSDIAKNLMIDDGYFNFCVPLSI